MPPMRGLIYEGVIKNTKKAIKDFFKNTYKKIKKKAKEIYRKIDREYGNHKKPSNFLPGKLIHYRYNAKDKTKKFDKNPLLICLGPSRKHPKTHFLGLNLHWMPMQDRVAVASFFLELRKKRGGVLTYDDIKPWISKFEGHPVLRMYIIKRVSDKVIEIPDDEMYLVAASLPTEVWFYPQEDLNVLKSLKKKGYSKEDIENMVRKI